MMRHCFPIVLAFIICLLPWFVQEQIKAINPDIAWLVEGASRLLEGRTMAGAVYDTNPPLSILVNMPVFLFKGMTGLSLENAVLLLTIFYAALSAAALFLILRRWPDLDFLDRVVFLCLFGIACTIFSYPDMGQRDQLIAFGLLPFVLLQLAITCRYSCARWLVWAVFFGGAILILLKPNYGLLPTMMLAHRMVVQKRINIFRDPDFIVLAIATTGYLAAIWLFFHDYIAVIFTDVVDLYARFTQIGFLVRAAFWGIIYLLGLLAVRRCAGSMPEGRRNILFFLPIAALVNLIPYIVMMRGFSYHILPSLICFVTGIGFFYYLLMRENLRPAVAAIITFVLLSFVGYGIHASPQVAKKQAIKDLPVTRLVRDCGPDCKFWMMVPSLPVTQLTAFYAEREHASRFPSMWFLKGMLRLKLENYDKYQHYAEKYASMIAADLKEYTPDLIIFCVHRESVSFLFEDAEFDQEWLKYEPDGLIQINYRDYYFKNRPRDAGLRNCDVYRRTGVRHAAGNKKSRNRFPI